MSAAGDSSSNGSHRKTWVNVAVFVFILIEAGAAVAAGILSHSVLIGIAVAFGVVAIGAICVAGIAVGEGTRQSVRALRRE